MRQTIILNVGLQSCFTKKGLLLEFIYAYARKKVYISVSIIVQHFGKT